MTNLNQTPAAPVISGVQFYRYDGDASAVPDRTGLTPMSHRYTEQNRDATLAYLGMSPNFRADAAHTMFFARQLEELDTQIWDVRYAKLEAGELVQPFGISSGAERYTYRMMDSRGQAMITSDYNGTAPIVDVDGAETSESVAGIVVGYRYNLQEIRAAQHAGMPIDSARALAARRIINEATNRVALLGNTTLGIRGLFNQSLAQSYNLTADGTGAATTFSSKTPDKIERDIRAFLNQVNTVTQEVESVKRVLLPYSVYRYLQQTTYSSNEPSITILEVLQKRFPGVEFRGALFLDTAGAGSGTRMIGYDPAVDHIRWLLPVAFETLPPFMVNPFTWEVVLHARVGGVVNYYPKAMIYADGV